VLSSAEGVIGSKPGLKRSASLGSLFVGVWALKGAARKERGIWDDLLRPTILFPGAFSAGMLFLWIDPGPPSGGRVAAAGLQPRLKSYAGKYSIPPSSRQEMFLWLVAKPRRN